MTNLIQVIALSVQLVTNTTEVVTDYAQWVPGHCDCKNQMIYNGFGFGCGLAHLKGVDPIGKLIQTEVKEITKGSASRESWSKRGSCGARQRESGLHRNGVK